MDTLGKRLKLLRDDLGMTANGVIVACARYGVSISSSAYNRYELDKVLPQSNVLAALAKALNTSTEYLSLTIDNPIPLLDIENDSGEYQQLARRITFLSERD